MGIFKVAKNIEYLIQKSDIDEKNCHRDAYILHLFISMSLSQSNVISVISMLNEKGQIV